MTSLPAPAWFIGCGNMVGAMIAGWRAAGVDFAGATIVRPSGTPTAGLRTLTRLPDGEEPRFVLLGVKPQKLDEVALSLAAHVNRDVTLVSILAGVECASLRRRFPGAGAIVRAMPNLPVSERRGVVALYSDETDAPREALTPLFAALGRAHWAASEAEFAAIGSLAGAGPAYVARFIAALAKAGEARGLSASLAATLALDTVAGTAALAEAHGEPMDAIARRVASPNGTTEAGLAILDANAALDSLLNDTLVAAARRGEELAVAARH